MGERINIQEYLDMIKRRKWIIISILLLSLALGGFRMYQNYISYVPTYTSSVMVKVDTMKVQKEEAAKEREKESKKGSKKNSKDNTDTSSYGQTANNGTGQSTEEYNLYNYSAIAQDESIASRYYTYAADSAAYDKVAQVAGVRASKVMSISASQSEDRLEEINITVTSSDAKSAQLIAAAMPKVYGDLLLKETGIDCVSTVYDATPGVRSHKRMDTSVPRYGLGGLVIAIFIVLLLEILNTKIITPDDVEKYWELPLLGVVPEFDDGPHSKKKKRK
ncbi:Wzz/FepE/Etk N-terminal domain-containing protein [Intestinibacter bartlettii]|uniref:Wzz/FepE/Etk N-terminal domain-containing protein n=1 Tax=Intestinibacter bartlettii TaxID=261299 RepID=UPI00319DCDA1